MTTPRSRPIPIVLLKTRSQPTDAYEEHFQSSRSETATAYDFEPTFIPVLEHQHNSSVISELAQSLREGQLKRKYGGLIFTSQRAVEAWIEVIHRAEQALEAPGATRPKSGEIADPFADLELLTPFPLYVVGPATGKALEALASASKAVPHSPFNNLNPSIHGAQSGNGAALAKYILNHYNQLYREHWFTYFEAPRLPFIPLLGMSSQNYGRKRLEKDDPRLSKKPLCFLVGETRRDVIPKTLYNAKDRVDVEEKEVYATEVVKTFEKDFMTACQKLDASLPEQVRIVVVFSPQGSDIMLRGLGHLDDSARAEQQATQARSLSPENASKWIVATIGPTTRDYLKTRFGVEADICAEQPSPAGLRKSIEAFLQQKSIAI